MNDRITETIAEHRWSIITHCCRCGDPATPGEWADHVVAALKAARIALVPLPAVEVDDDGQQWFNDGDIRIDTTGGRVEAFVGDNQVTTAWLRQVAVEFLAAAEAVSNG